MDLDNPGNSSLVEVADALDQEYRRYSLVIGGWVVAMMAAVLVLVLLQKPDLLWIVIVLLAGAFATLIPQQRVFDRRFFNGSDLLLNMPGVGPLKVILSKVLNKQRLARKPEIRLRFLRRFAEELEGGGRPLDLTDGEKNVLFGFASAIAPNSQRQPEEEAFLKQVIANSDWLLKPAQVKTLELVSRLGGFL